MPAVAAPAGRWFYGWTLVLVLLALCVALVVSQGDRVVELVGGSAPPVDEFDVRRVQLRPGEIRAEVRNPQRDDLTIAAVTVDDAIVPFTLDGPATLERLRSSCSASTALRRAGGWSRCSKGRARSRRSCARRSRTPWRR